MNLIKKLKHVLPCACMAASLTASAQRGITVTGSVQSDILIPSELTDEVTDRFCTNTYAEVSLLSAHADAGLRLEFLEYPMPGYDKDMKGWGVPHFYVRPHFNKWELTLGHFYEQFGSGFILRTYEERSLGIDNALLGARLMAKPYNGITLKALAGKQRRYWDLNDLVVSGADLELNIDEWVKPMSEAGTYLSVGASVVNKREDDEEVQTIANGKLYRLNLPQSVNAFDFRARLQTHGFNILAEYAVKGQDPNTDNNFIYRQGNVAMLSASYSKKGFSALLQAKRSDNMSFRSKRSINRDAHPTSSFINHLPAFTMDHTYSLAALYLYATNPGGEWAYQAEIGYKFKKGTAMGGKYGTMVKLNASYVRGIDMTPIDGGGMGTDGYSSNFLKQGNETFYQDINVQFDKKFTKNFKLALMYMNQRYNKTIVEGHGGMINSHIYVADAKYQFNKKLTLRGELQFLNTRQDDGNWAFALLELSMAPHWMITVADMWNCGVTKEHYYQGYVTYSHNAHRLQLGYARTREGYNCSGGVCRHVPESKGVTASYNYNF